jgi:hypothetical protein
MKKNEGEAQKEANKEKYYPNNKKRRRRNRKADSRADYDG